MKDLQIDHRSPPPSEVAELLAMKAKHGFGGEFQPDWQPPVRHICLRAIGRLTMRLVDASTRNRGTPASTSDRGCSASQTGVARSAEATGA